MTQAFNLSQFANFVDSNGKLTASTGVTGTLPVANGGTALTSYTPYALLSGSSSGLAITQIPPDIHAGYVLTSTGTAWQGQSPTLGATNNFVAFVTNITWTVPTGITRAIVFVAGGGGGANGQKGGLGGQVHCFVTGLTPGATISITVGQGGNGDWGGSPYINTAGGTSSFGSYIVCTGGAAALGSAGANGTYTLASAGGVTPTIIRSRGLGTTPSGASTATGQQTWSLTSGLPPGYNQTVVATGDPKTQNAGVGGAVIIEY